ncbi:MAG: metallophosphoesterase family protein [Selenomonadaceae bacterium]|nr:metallophosphoesterase family protein [Selenomonadaceae bacterium]
MSRRLFIKLLLSLGLGAYFPKLVEASRYEKLHTPQDGYEPLRQVKFLRQLITQDSRTSRVIMWQCEKFLDTQLELELIGEGGANFCAVDTEKFLQDDATIYIYTCRIENLKPESLYRFRIISGDAATGWQNLLTPGYGNFQMLIFSDSQCVNYDVWQKVADTAAKNFPDAELFTVVGDLVDNGQAAYQWRAWYLAAARVLSERIFAPVMGNHECYNLDWLNYLPVDYLHQFYLPSNGTKNFGGYFYSFDYGAAHFFVLNTQFLELEKFTSNLQDEQNYWLRRDAANVNRRWKIVFMHKDVYNYAADNFNDIAENFMPLFDELEIDVVFTGHLHTYRNRGKIFAQKKSARGTLYILCGRSGDQKYVEPHSPIDDVTAPNLQTEPESYITLDVSAESLSLTCQTVDGTILDKFTLKKF